MEITRRPIKSRSRTWVQGLAARLAGFGITPNAISICSLVFAAAAGACLLASQNLPFLSHAALLIAAALGIQLRLICNLLDGLVAVEHGKKTPTGELFNEVPDRLADTVLFVSVGYALPAYPAAVALGWAAALAAALTAYIRTLGGALSLPQRFTGPMAKPHRMAVLTAACIASPFEMSLHLQRGLFLWVALWIILSGSAVTCVRRLLGIARELRVR